MVEGGLHLCGLLASSVRLLTRSSALSFREKKVKELSLHASLVPQAVGVLSGQAVVLLVWGKGRKVKVTELARCCWRELAGPWAGRAACRAAQPHPPRLAQPFAAGVCGGTGTCTPRHGQVPGSCLHCPLVCSRAGRCHCRPAPTLRRPRPCSSVSEAGSSRQERAGKPWIAPPWASSPQMPLGSGL